MEFLNKVAGWDFAEVRRTNDTYCVLGIMNDTITLFQRRCDDSALSPFLGYTTGTSITEKWENAEVVNVFPKISKTDTLYIGDTDIVLMNLITGELKDVCINYIDGRHLIYGNKDTREYYSGVEWRWVDMAEWWEQAANSDSIVSALVNSGDDNWNWVEGICGCDNRVGDLSLINTFYNTNIMEYHNLTNFKRNDIVKFMPCRDICTGVVDTVMRSIITNHPYNCRFIVSNYLGGVVNVYDERGEYAALPKIFLTRTGDNKFQISDGYLLKGTTVLVNSFVEGTVLEVVDGASYVHTEQGCNWFSNSELHITKLGDVSNTDYNGNVVTKMITEKDSIHIQPDDIKVGAEYYIKTWNTMCSRYGTNTNGEPCFVTRFTENMKHLCGKKVQVKEVVSKNTVLVTYKGETIRLALDALAIRNKKPDKADIINNLKIDPSYDQLDMFDDLKSGYYFITSTADDIVSGWYAYINPDNPIICNPRMYSLNGQFSLSIAEIKDGIATGEVVLVAYSVRPLDKGRWSSIKRNSTITVLYESSGIKPEDVKTVFNG